MMIIEICVSIATLVFAVLAGYLIYTCIAVKKSLNHLNDLVVDIKTKIDPLCLETLRLLQTSNEVSKDVKNHIAAFEPLTTSISDLGTKLHQATTSAFEERKAPVKNKLDNMAEVVALAILVWQQIKKRR